MAISQFPLNTNFDDLQDEHAKAMAARFFPSYISLIGSSVNLLYKVNKRAACRLTMGLLSTALRRKIKDRHRQFYTAGRRTMHRWQQHQFYTYTYGEGPAVLLLHGWCGQGTRWQSQVQQLVAAGFQAIVMDAPGHGLSPGRFLSVPDYIQCVRTVLDSGSNWHSLVTHSMGSLVGVIAASESKQVDSKTRFVLMNTFANCDRLMSKFILCLGVEPHVLQATREYIENYTGQPLSYFTLDQHLQQLGAAALLIADGDDIVVPRGEAQRILTRLPHVQYRPTKGLGHNLRSEELVTEITAYLQYE